jgi:uncharacterized membrane protein YeaQ/YmgE (transglycosylase-associated protein family)
MHFIWFIVIGIIAGWLAGLLTKGKGFGLLGNLAVGVIGALVGGFLFAVLGLKAYTVLGSLVTSVVGAVVFLWLLRLIKPT